MSRSSKWKLEKAKVKVVFRLQFHATHIPHSGWDKLFISFIPADSGKATAKTSKAIVRNGTCKWGDPIYETTRLLQDCRTKRYDEKLYRFVVAMGSSRSSLLGEANINLADYADALKPFAVSLPLQGTDSGTILHVTVQLLTSKTGFREFEQQRELREQGLPSTNQVNSDDSSGKGLSPEETLNNQIDKASAKVRFKSESKEQISQEEAGLNDDYTDSAVGFDGSSNTSESLYAEKHEISSMYEIDSLKSTTSGDLNQSPQLEKVDASDNRIRGWASDYSLDNDLVNAYEETSKLRGCLEVTESSVLELKMEVSSLQTHAKSIGVETQKFTEIIASEIASGEELMKEVSFLKSECLKFKDDLESLKKSKLGPQISSVEAISGTPDWLLQDLQSRWLKGILILEDKLRELQNKTYFGFHERDFRFLHLEFEALLGVLQDLKQSTSEAISELTMGSSLQVKMKEITEAGVHESAKFVSENRFDMGLDRAENTAHITGLPYAPDSKYAADSFKGRFFELLRDLDESKAERENLMKKMGQMECYYEALVQELEENQKQMLGELQSLRNEHSTCQYKLTSANTQMETMQQDMNEQISRFSEDREELEVTNKELERRAIISEAALKRARLNYSIAVDKLQKDLELLSSQVSSMFETNESLMAQTYAEASQLCFPEYLGLANDEKLELKEEDTGKLKCQNRCIEVKEHTLGGDILLEDWKKSLHLQEEVYWKVEEELCELHTANMHLDVLSKTLQETLLEALVGIGLMEKRINELTQQLGVSDKSEQLLMKRLQNATDDVESLNEYKSDLIARFNDVALQNQNLEAKLGSSTRENCLLQQKISEFEALVEECRAVEMKFQDCAAEKTEFKSLLNEESLQNSSLRNEISSLQEETRTFKTELEDLTSSKEKMRGILNFVQDKLETLLASYDKKANGEFPRSTSLSHDLELEDFMGVLSKLQDLQHAAEGKILQLLDENKYLKQETETAQASLEMGTSEILMIKQKFGHDMQEITGKLNVSSTRVQELQMELEAVANRLNVRSEAEENYVEQTTQHYSDFARLEVELEQVTSRNKDLAGKISVMETLFHEFERNQLTIAELTQQNRGLVESLQYKTDESEKFVLEIDNLRKSLKALQDELHAERGDRSNLEDLYANLSCELADKNDQLLQFDQQKAEIIHLKQLTSDLESEKTEVCSLLKHFEEHLNKVHHETTPIAHIENEISEMLELLIALDVQFIFTRLQYETRLQELVHQLQSSDDKLRTLHKDHFGVENRLNQCLLSQKQYTVENSNLLTNLVTTKADLDACIEQNRNLLELNSSSVAEIERYKNQIAASEISFLKDINDYVSEVELLKHMLACSQQELDNLLVSKVELETTGIVYEEKLNEQQAQKTLDDDKLVILQNQCKELNHKLSAQILKTEEFKNLSIHLRELKDKADAECVQAREKRESEAPSVATQESLRIAFIREQYETKVQELKHQLSISKKHGEEMLWKLQDAINEVENRKKCEASHLKKNEELLLKILDLEAELHSVISEKQEKSSAYDQLTAEMDCSLITLECCKEEKEILEASLQACNMEKYSIAAELESMKELLVGSTYSINAVKEGSEGPREADFTTTKLITQKGSQDVLPENGSTRSLCEGVVERESQEQFSIQSKQGAEEVLRLDHVGKEKLACIEAKQLALINDQFKAQSLKLSMEHLHKELERLISENSIPPQDVHVDPKVQGFQRELMQLRKVNEELGNMFPLFKEFPLNGNALERVLALEMELAEALQSKNKSSIFQSSFLKQHADEEAIFQSFRDINELIKDMLDLKGRNAAVENELKEMRDRYSQLSLQFAEVEGERQKLMMTLKNVRASRVPLRLNSSSATLG